MPWPSDQDYNEAVQNPKSAFQDADLQSGQIELNPLGIPRPRAGNFATVYKVFVNGVPYAAKCFKRDEPEYGRRYPAIATHLNNTRLPYFVPFRYMSQGIRVGGSLYPLLKMKWAEGESLISYVQKNLNTPTVLQGLAASWIRLLTDLQKASIAHGDLQHGNVLVIGGQLKLVDYDGMYVPALEGSRGLEDGHSNYQHPERTGLDFGPYLDNFSAWLIYVSLLALSVRPKLWQELKSGDEFLLFRKQDLAAPDQSEAFRLLRAIPDENTRDLVERLEDFLWMTPSRIPPINEDVLTHRPPPSTPASPQLAGWIKDHIDPIPSHASELTVDNEESDIGDPSWIQDHVKASPPVGSFQNSVWVDRVTAFLALAAISAISAWTWLGAGVPEPVLTRLVALVTAAGSTLLFWYVRYLNEPVRKAIRITASQLREADNALRAERVQHDQSKTKRQHLRDTLAAELLKIQTRENSLLAEEAKESARIDADLKNMLRQLHDKRRTAATDEANQKRQLAEIVTKLSNNLSAMAGQQQHELGLLDSGLGNKIRGLEGQLQQTTGHQASELGKALKDYQDQIVMSHLHRCRIADADISGIGEELKRRLAQSGFVSAADIVTRQVTVAGIGTKKWASLRTWVMGLDNITRLREAPQVLPSHKTADIERRYETSINHLQQDLARERSRFATETQSIKKTYFERRRLLEEELRIEESRVHQQMKLIDSNFELRRASLDSDDSRAKAVATKAVQECTSRFRALTAETQEQAGRLRSNYSSELENISEELGESAKRVREAVWRRDRSSRNRAAYSKFEFGHYCSRMISGRND